MLNIDQIDLVVQRAVASTLKSALSRVSVEPTTDAFGQDALQVVIILKTEESLGVRGDDAIETLVRLNRDLQKSGDDRFAFINYATEAEMASHGDLQS